MSKISECLDVESFPTPTEGMAMIMKAAGNSELSLKKLAKLIEGEPSFTLELLRVANSPVFGYEKQVKTVRRASVLLGTRIVRNHAVAHVVRVLASQVNLEDFDGATFWEDSLRRAAIARELAIELGYEEPMEAFTVGLIQDVGLLLMASFQPEDAIRLQAATRMIGPARIREEEKLIETNHADLLCEIADRWSLPPALIEAIKLHHQDASESDSLLTHIARTADKIADVFQVDNKSAALEIARASLMSIPNCEIVFEDIAEQTLENMPSLARELNIRIGRQPTLSELNRQVNESLVEITIQYEQMTQELQAAVDAKEEMARMLAKANIELRKLATTDELTRVANRRRFMEALNGEVLRSVKKGVNLSVIILDIDKFKTVNDTWGHEAGNDVLKMVVQRLAGVLRGPDLIGRIGGEEFAILLPNSDQGVASTIAERCRACLEDAPVVCRDGVEINITASFGGYTASSGHADDWLRFADSAMYQSKEGGRNRVTWAQV